MKKAFGTLTTHDFIDPGFVRRKAEKALATPPMHITDHIAALSEGGPHDAGWPALH